MVTEKHPNYLLIFILLAVFTLTETLVSYVQQEAIKFPILVVLSAVKALLVLLNFMHLRFDSKVFRYVFIGACVIAIPLILTITIVMPKIV
jgi:cytochrome c oxidase subunit 4